MKKRRQGVAAGVLAAVVAAGMLTGCGAEAPAQEQSLVVPVQVQTPERGTLTLKNEFMGTISPQEAVSVIPMVSAQVLSTQVAVGDEVAAGDVLCKLDSEAAQLQMASAEAGYASAQAGLNTAQAGLNSAQVGYEGAVAAYANAEAQADAQLGGAKKLQDYNTQNQIDDIKEGLDDLEENIDEIRDERDDAKKKYKDAQEDVEEAEKALASASSQLSSLKEEKTVSGSAATPELEAKIEAAQAAQARAAEALAGAQAAYAQRKAAYEQLKDAKDDLQETYDDTQESLARAETAKQISDEDVYNDTKKIVDTTKAAALSSVKSAEAGIASAQVGMESAEAGIQSAQVGIESAQYQLDMYTLTAPIGGVIEAVNVEDYGFASPGSPAFVISNKDTMTVTFAVSEGIRNTFRVGDPVSVERSGRTYEAAITEIGSMVDQTTGLFEVKASVAAPDASLLTGSSVKVLADTYEQSGALLVPYDAVYYADAQPYVYVAEDGKAVRKNIETGIFDETTMSVLSGLSPSDAVIVSWSSNLRDGAEISVQEEAES